MLTIPSFSLQLLILSVSLSPLARGISGFERSVARQSLQSDGYGGEGSLIPALATEDKPATVIVLHGLGGNGNEWAYLFLPVSLLSLTYVNFILPTAESRPVAYMNKTSMPSWFDISTLDMKGQINIQINRSDLDRSVRRVNRIVEGEMKKGVASERIFLMGFSQGGAVALTAFLRSRHTLGGCMGVATWLPWSYMGKKSDKAKKKKILLLHGTADKTIKFLYARKGAEILKNFGYPVQFVPIKDGPHELLTKEVLTRLEAFIIKEAPGPMQALTKLVDQITTFFNSLTSNANR